MYSSPGTSRRIPCHGFPRVLLGHHTVTLPPGPAVSTSAADTRCTTPSYLRPGHTQRTRTSPHTVRTQGVHDELLSRPVRSRDNGLEVAAEHNAMAVRRKHLTVIKRLPQWRTEQCVSSRPKFATCIIGSWAKRSGLQTLRRSCNLFLSYAVGTTDGDGELQAIGHWQLLFLSVPTTQYVFTLVKQQPLNTSQQY